MLHTTCFSGGVGTGSVFLACVILLGGSCAEKSSEQTAPTSSPPVVASSTPGVSSVRVTQGTNMSATVSPDGRSMVLSIQGALFILPASGGDSELLLDEFHDAREPVWSPDGTELVYQGYFNGTYNIWRLDPVRRSTTALTQGPYDDREPHYSPDGSRIAFSSDRSGSYDIWVLEDGDLRRLTEHPGNEHSPAYSPDGRYLAYARQLDDNSYQINLLDVATTQKSKVGGKDGAAGVEASQGTHEDDEGGPDRTLVVEKGEVAGLTWHPSGKGLTYQLTSRSAAGNAATELRALDLESGMTQTLSEAGVDVFPFRSNWTSKGLLYTADGKIKLLAVDGTLVDIAFTAEFTLRREPYERRKIDHDSRGDQRVLGIVSPRPSPDGSRVVYGALGDLWMIEVASGAIIQLTDDVHADQDPTWSPDGEKIAFVSDRSGSPDLHILNLADGSILPVPGARSIARPSWSPQGDQLAFFMTVPGNPLAQQMYLLDLNHGDLRPLLRPLPTQGISWSEDGRYLATLALQPYSSRYREGVYKVLIVDLGSGQDRILAPVANSTMADAQISAAGLTYLADGQLWQVDLDSNLVPSSEPRVLIDALADMHGVSANGRDLVYAVGDEIFITNLQSGTASVLPVNMTYRPDHPDETWVLRVGRLFDGDSNAYQMNRDIVIEGNRIREIRPSGPVGEGKLVDASQSTAMPGLFEMHAHLGNLSEVQGRTWLAYGVTTVRDPGSHPYLAKSRQESWDSGRSPGPRTHITGFLTDGDRVFYSIAEGIRKDLHLERALERIRKLELDFVKTYVRLPDRQQALVIKRAHEMGIPVSSHELYPAVAVGADHVEHIGGTSRRGYQPKVSALGFSYGDVVELLASSGMGITPTLVLPGFTLIVKEQPDFFDTPQFKFFYGDAIRAGYQRLAESSGGGVASYSAANGRLLRALRDRGALVVSGTDSPFVPFGAGLHAELRLYERAGLTPYEILRASTEAAARATGVADDLGTIAPGKLADIVLVNGDPLNNIRDADIVVMTIKDGRLYTIDELLMEKGL